LVADTAKNGSPTATSSSPSRYKSGLPSAGGAQSPAGTARGSTRSGKSTTTRCTMACLRAPSQEAVACT
jgi:hypothetical protein